MARENLDYCDANFRYVISEVEGQLRFTSFEVTGQLAGTKFADIVARYFKDRPLAQVRREDIEAMREAGDIRCLRHIMNSVLALRKTIGK